LKKDNPNSKYVTLTFCNERFNRIMDKLDAIDKKVDELKNQRRQSGRDWKLALLSILSGSTVAAITWILSHIKV